LVPGYQPNGQPDLIPTIPALTPLGFTQWMTIHILAHPNNESKRLGRVVKNMAIDADGETLDGKPERLPKQLSRHLLPQRYDPKSRDLGNYTWAELSNKVHVILIQNPEKGKHLILICALTQRKFQVIILGASRDDLSWLPSTCEFWEA
jgi:hypothetical protein